MTDTMPEPPDRAIVGLFARNDDDNAPDIFRRDDEQIQYYDGDEPVWLGQRGEYGWSDVLNLAAEENREVVRLYRADDTAVTGWYEGGGVWADAIEEARKAVLAAGSVVTIERPDDEHIEVHVNGQVVATANYDEHGWSGMDAVVKTALAVARALGGTVNG